MNIIHAEHDDRKMLEIRDQAELAEALCVEAVARSSLNSTRTSM
jgi:hypothetical protein